MAAEEHQEPDNEAKPLTRIEAKLGLPLGFLQEVLAKDSDWAFVVKVHALIESALGASLTRMLERPELERPITHLPFRTKKDWAEQIHGLSKDQARFIDALSSVRNHLAHQVRNIPGFSLPMYAATMASHSRNALFGERDSTKGVMDSQFVLARTVIFLNAVNVLLRLEIAEGEQEVAKARELDAQRQLMADELMKLLADSAMDPKPLPED